VIEGTRPLIAHSQQSNSENIIRAFRHSDKRWLVSVNMVSEGVDIKRMRVLVYLPKAMTELAFRQAVGRIVRKFGKDDDTRGYVVMPHLKTLETYARRVEQEMSPNHRRDPGRPKSKCCPVCENDCPLGAQVCDFCGHEFPERTPRLKTCNECGSLNPMSARECQHCGKSFSIQFDLTLDEALRAGAIVRGMDLDESEVLEGEQLAPEVRRKILATNDPTLTKIVSTLPPESWARLRDIFDAS
jgi:DNA or RNA helicases of superfamily II